MLFPVLRAILSAVGCTKRTGKALQCTLGGEYTCWVHATRHCITITFHHVSGVSRAKIEEVTLDALRTRQSLVKGERLVRHEMRAVLPFIGQYIFHARPSWRSMRHEKAPIRFELYLVSHGAAERGAVLISPAWYCNLPGWRWATITKVALDRLSRSLHSDVCDSDGCCDAVLHSTISGRGSRRERAALNTSFKPTQGHTSPGG